MKVLDIFKIHTDSIWVLILLGLMDMIAKVQVERLWIVQFWFPSDWWNTTATKYSQRNVFDDNRSGNKILQVYSFTNLSSAMFRHVVGTPCRATSRQGLLSQSHNVSPNMFEFAMNWSRPSSYVNTFLSVFGIKLRYFL